MDIFYIVPYAPTPIRTRPYNLLKAIRRLGHNITLFTIYESEGESWYLNQLAEEGILVHSMPISKPRIALNLLHSLFSAIPMQARYSWQPELAKIIAAKLEVFHNGCDIIHAEHLRGAVYGLYLKQVMPRLNRKVPIVWDSVDNISSLFEQAIQKSESFFGRWITRFELSRTRRYERDLVGQFDQTLVTSNFDKEAFEKLLLSDNAAPSFRRDITVLSNGVDLEYFQPTNEPRLADTIVFSGKLSYHANVTSAMHLAKQIMPEVWTRRPQVKVQLVGKDPPPGLLGLQREEPRIQVTGTVSDLRPYLRQASLAVAPLTYGAGIQNKILEAMACGTPVVAYPKAFSALQAIPGQDLLVADSASRMAEEIIRLLDNEDLRNNIGQNGRQYVTDHHDWNQIARNAITIYENLRHATS